MAKSNKKNKPKKSSLKKIQKKVKNYTNNVSKNTILLGIAGGAVISGLLFAGIRTSLGRNIKKADKDLL